MNTQLSPKDLALVIGVSESSLKRWVDEGRLIASRTAGGHRRIALHEAIRFIRDSNQVLARPELLGLTDLTSVPMTAVSTGRGEVALLRALENGQGEVARGLIMAHYLSNRSVAGVCDGPITHAMHRIGELWRHSESGIMVEHRATEIVIEAVHQIRATLPPVADGAPKAIGSAGPGDPYTLPTLMASTTLLECGYQETNLGPNLPMESLIAAAKDARPRLVWVAASVVTDRTAFFDGMQKLGQTLAAFGGTLVIGGRAVAGQNISASPNTHMVASMTELASFAKGLKVEPRPATPPAPQPVTDATVAPNGHSTAPASSVSPGKAKPKR